MPEDTFGTADDYYVALTGLESEGIHPKHLDLLRAHFAAPDHTATWAELADAVGYSSGSTVNLQYGKFAHRVAERLGVQQAPTSDQFRGSWWGYVLVVFASEGGTLGHTAYVLRRPLVAALKRMGWKISRVPSRPRARAAARADHKNSFTEGAARDIVQTVRERDPRLRRECLQHYGATCVVCAVALESVYGGVAADLVHVHHLNPLAEAKGPRETNAVRDLRPVCPNCHGVIHRRTPPFSVEEVRAFVADQRA